MSLYPKITKWFIPTHLLSKSLAEMRVDGENGNEGICLWLGMRNQENERATVSHIVELRGSGIVKMPAQIQIQPELMRDVHDAARELDRILIGQIHSHGTEYGTGLSFVDVKYGISVPYYLSVVAPHYALKPETNWKECGAHVYMPLRGYVRVPSTRIITIDGALPLQVITVGDEH